MRLSSPYLPLPTPGGSIGPPNRSLCRLPLPERSRQGGLAEWIDADAPQPEGQAPAADRCA